MGGPSQSVAQPQPPQTNKIKGLAVKSAPLIPSKEPALARTTSMKDDAQSVQKQQSIAAMVNASEKDKDESTQRHQPMKNSQKAAGQSSYQLAKSNKVSVAVKEPIAWTQPNANFVPGHPMLAMDELERVGSATAALHEYYMKLPLAKIKHGILVSYNRTHFLRSQNSELFNVGFSDIYELLNFDGLDVSLLRCYTLMMLMEAKKMNLPVGFLDPELMTLSAIRFEKSYVVDYVRKAFRTLAKKECIMFPHNTGDHWILVAVVLKWNKVLYFDSLRARPQDHTLLKDVLDEAFLTYSTAYKMDTGKLMHVTKFPCHQQRPGNEYGFYTAHHMTIALGLLNAQRLERTLK